jgi:hypothetical protein
MKLYRFLLTTASFLFAYQAKAVVLSINYDTAFDQNYCTSAASIKPEWVDEALRAQPIIIQTWQATGPKWILEAEKIFQWKYPLPMSEVTFFLCKDLPSTSSPTLIRLFEFLAGPTNNEPYGLEFLIDELFHEFLHKYLNARLASATHWPSPLYAKYQNESKDTLDHLHLYALQMQIYKKFGNTAHLKAAKLTAQGNGPKYIRALEIVETEGEGAFIQDLKSILP